jgi:hypothetical protein
MKTISMKSACAFLFDNPLIERMSMYVFVNKKEDLYTLASYHSGEVTEFSVSGTTYLMYKHGDMSISFAWEQPNEDNISIPSTN